MKSLGEISPAETPMYGGKAAGLARLLAASARVPDGFAVEATLQPPSAWTEMARGEFVRRAEELLLGGRVAVRSSALAEDSKERSFAGLFETRLGVRSPEEAIEAAGRCIASGGLPRVLAYAGSGSPVPVGVVVQRMVEAAFAGVCFTADPAGEDAAVVVEAVRGTGEALVSGRAAPDRWRCYLSGLGRWRCDAGGPASVLDAGRAAEIAGQAKALEMAFGFPLDLEWAVDPEGLLWWLQARPITAMKPPRRFVISRSCPEADDGPVTVWSNWNVRETLPDPLPPLTWTFWAESVLPTVGESFFGFRKGSTTLKQLSGLDLVNGRIYFNMNALLAIPILGSLPSRVLTSMDARAAAALGELRREGVLTPRRIAGPRLLLGPTFLAASAMWLLGFRKCLAPARAMRKLEKQAASVAHRTPPADMSDSDLLRELRLWEMPETRGLLIGLHLEMSAILIYHAALQAFREHPRAGEFLAKGIPANPTTRISLAADELAQAAVPIAGLFEEAGDGSALLERLGSSPEGREWLEGLRDFLALYGHRGPREFDLGAPRWREDPSMILGLVRARLLAGGERLPNRLGRLAAERREEIGKAVAEAPLWRRPVLRVMARLVELYMPLREAPKHYGMFVFTRIRFCALELGRRLAARGSLERADDIFFLEMRELESLPSGPRAAGGLAAAIPSRRAQFESFRGYPAPDLLRSDGVPVREEPPPETPADGLLRGTPISGGIGRGRVRILREPDPASVRAGEVLVVPFADPGWTPLFPGAAAVVMEVGGLMCHAAVVAREMGIPAVFGVTGATRRLEDGQPILVDGSAGTVEPDGEASSQPRAPEPRPSAGP
jgi:rifampicin phosphotransferase